ncbi:hypothetical protein P20652_0586 [Pseudoalteromonas sp. BSi20652]|nr:hypothetical protein P20652_0586 [Pseudoalteromonas sp. BSi20652]
MTQLGRVPVEYKTHLVLTIYFNEYKSRQLIHRYLSNNYTLAMLLFP